MFCPIHGAELIEDGTGNGDVVYHCTDCEPDDDGYVWFQVAEHEEHPVPSRWPGLLLVPRNEIPA